MKYRELKEPVQELVTYLVTLSLTPEKQIEIHGIGDPAIEMKDYIRYEDRYSADIDRIRSGKLIQKEILSKIELFLYSLLQKDNNFWYSFEVSEDWVKVRKEAKQLIKEIGLEELTIITDFTKKLTNSGVVETQNIFLVIEKSHTEDELVNDVKESKLDSINYLRQPKPQIKRIFLSRLFDWTRARKK